MNTETGKVYSGAEEIQAAEGRGEPLAHLSPEVARHVKACNHQLAAEQRRKEERANNRCFAERYMSRERR